MTDRVAYTVPEAAEAARISRASLYNSIRDGELVLTKRGRRSLILADDLLAWLRAGRQAKAA